VVVNMRSTLRPGLSLPDPHVLVLLPLLDSVILALPAET